MKGKYLHIAFLWKGKPKIKEIEPVFDLSLSWVRYTPNCWIVWTTSSAQKWYDRLKSHLGIEDQVFICKLDLSERQGWLSKSVWKWLREDRSKGQ